MSQKKTLLKYTKYVMWGTVALIPPAAFFYLLEFYTHNPFAEVRPWAQLFNIVLFELLAGIFLCITERLRTAYRIEGTAALVFGLANAYVVRFRTNPLVPWDILSWRTAVSVSGNYDFTPDTRMIVVTILFLALIIGLQPVKFKIGRPGFFKRCLPGVVLGAVLVMFAGTLQQENFQNEHRLYNKLFTPVFMTQVDGIPVTFVMNLAYMSIEKPQKYSVGEAKEFLKKYEEPQETEESIDTILEEEGKDASDDTSQSGADTGMPNIIVVMNESFSDLSVLGDFKTNEDYMPFLHSLQQGAENTVTGMLNVSVCGGNTADTEYEFLTGNTMAFLPQGSVPYQQYVNGERPSLASYLQSLGYETVATHPYYATGWNRDKVYPWLGFEQSIFKDQYYGARFVRDYVSDASCADKIIQLYEQKEEGRPLFVFNVTMQNHGGYDQSCTNFSPGILVTSLTEITIPKTLKNGSVSPCLDNPNITKITLEDGLTIVPKNLCANTGITEIVIPDSVTEIEYSAFDNCTKLKKITILDNVTKIGFYNISDSDSIFKSHDKDLTVYCYKDSMAANYAIKYNIKYVYLTKPAIDNNEENKEDKKQNVTEPAIDAKQEDTTIATGKLPQAGSSSVIIISIIAVMVILIINYKRYNSYKDIK